VSWFRRLLGSGGSGGREQAAGVDAGHVDPELALAVDGIFVCTTCGRSDLPEAGDWDPPICQECDAAINFDAIQEMEDFEDR
jgi:hypothetical protein